MIGGCRVFCIFVYSILHCYIFTCWCLSVVIFVGRHKLNVVCIFAVWR